MGILRDSRAELIGREKKFINTQYQLFGYLQIKFDNICEYLLNQAMSQVLKINIKYVEYRFRKGDRNAGKKQEHVLSIVEAKKGRQLPWMLLQRCRDAKDVVLKCEGKETIKVQRNSMCRDTEHDTSRNSQVLSAL